MGESQVEFALEILLGDLKILQGHVGTLVAKEFDDRGKANPSAQHLSSVCVSKLVRDDAGGNAEGGGDFSQGGAHFAIAQFATTMPLVTMPAPAAPHG